MNPQSTIQKLILAALVAGALSSQALPQSQAISQEGRASGQDSAREPADPLGSHTVEPARRKDTTRRHGLMRDGVMYLSLQDAVSLAVDNNLEIETARLMKPSADADVLQASSGQPLRDVADQQAASPVAAPPIGNDALSSLPSAGVLSPVFMQLAGSEIPNLDPVFYSVGAFGHITSPESNRVITGTNSLVSDSRLWEAGLRKSTLTGTTFDIRWTSLWLNQNAPNNVVNPATYADLAVTVRQHLLKGLSFAGNRRAIHIAENSRNSSDLEFRNQVNTSVSEVVGLYYDLVALKDELKILTAGLEEARRLRDEGKRRLEMGVITQTSLSDAQGDAEATERAVQAMQVQVLQQELTLKSALTSDGLYDAAFVQVPLVLTDHFAAPEAGIDSAENVPAEAADRALKTRVEIRQSEMRMQNKRYSLEGVRDGMRPTLDAFVSLQNNALAGSLNTAYAPSAILNDADPAFIGGSGTVLNQLATRKFPDYSVGFQLNVPLSNHAAKAELMRDELDYREQVLSDQKLRNRVRLEALKAGVAVQQASKEYFAAVKARESRDNNYHLELKSAEYGTSDLRRVTDARRELEVSKLSEIAALNTYAHAKSNLEYVEGKTWDAFHTPIEEAEATASAPQR